MYVIVAQYLVATHESTVLKRFSHVESQVRSRCCKPVRHVRVCHMIFAAPGIYNIANVIRAGLLCGAEENTSYVLTYRTPNRRRDAACRIIAPAGRASQSAVVVGI